MVKAFNEREKELIRQKLIEKGREQFQTLGLKKTSISDLTKQAGIAQGSFYLFFASKEELFFEILEMEEEKLKEELLKEVFQTNEIGKATLKKLLVHGLKLVDENPMIRRIYFEDEYEVLKRKLPPERLEKHIEQDTDLLSPLISLWQEQGILIPVKVEVISGVIRSFFTISLHKKEIGEEVYDETLDLLAEMIADGLMKKKGDQHDRCE